MMSFIFTGLAAGEGFFDPSAFIGTGVSDFIESWGFPDSVYPLRGDEPWQDDVVFYYSRGISFYLFKERVWQVRIDEHSPFSWRGIGPGSRSSEIAGALGKAPIHSESDWEVYFLAEMPFPLRLRVFYEDGQAVDFYLYRGDF